MKVLVVDDDRLVSSSLKTILEADGEIEVVGTLGGGASGREDPFPHDFFRRRIHCPRSENRSEGISIKAEL